MSAGDTVLIAGKIVMLSAKAIRLKGYGGGKTDRWKIWLPRSVICEDTKNLNIGDIVELNIFKWWARNEGLD